MEKSPAFALEFRLTLRDYLNHFNKLKGKGLKYVDLTISDDHKGLIRAQQAVFPNTPHQRCICHFMRNVLSYVPFKEKKKLACYLKQIFNSPNRQMATAIAQMIAQKYQDSYHKVSDMLQEELEFTLTYLDYPDHHQRKIRITNLIVGFQHMTSIV